MSDTRTGSLPLDLSFSTPLSGVRALTLEIQK